MRLEDKFQVFSGSGQWYAEIPVPPPHDSGNRVKNTENQDNVVTEFREHKPLVEIVDINDSDNSQASEKFLKRHHDYIAVVKALREGRPLMEVVNINDAEEG